MHTKPYTRGEPAVMQRRIDESWTTRLLRHLRRGWRVVRFMGSILAHTSFLWLTVRLVPPQARAAYRARRQQIACGIFCRILGIRVSVHGTLPEAGAVLAVSNHLGLFDPWVLASRIPLAFVAKAEMRRWPVAGWICRTVGIIFVERERRMQAGTFVEQVQRRLRDGVRVLVFPEGTTSKGTTVMPFKTGGFEAVAGMEDAYVLPLCLNPLEIDGHPAVGALREWITWADPDQSMGENLRVLLGLRGVHMQVRVGTPIATDRRDRKELARLAHAAVRELHAAGIREAAS